MLLNGNMYDYKVPTALDQPKIEGVPWRRAWAAAPYGSTGVAHAHTNAGLVGLAIQNAIGAWVNVQPFTPDKVLAALASKQQA